MRHLDRVGSEQASGAHEVRLEVGAGREGVFLDELVDGGVVRWNAGVLGILRGRALGNEHLATASRSLYVPPSSQLTSKPAGPSSSFRALLELQGDPRRCGVRRATREPPAVMILPIDDGRALSGVGEDGSAARDDGARPLHAPGRGGAARGHVAPCSSAGATQRHIIGGRRRAAIRGLPSAGSRAAASGLCAAASGSRHPGWRRRWLTVTTTSRSEQHSYQPERRGGSEQPAQRCGWRASYVGEVIRANLARTSARGGGSSRSRASSNACSAPFCLGSSSHGGNTASARHSFASRLVASNRR
jgi:hypothetical protein